MKQLVTFALLWLSAISIGQINWQVHDAHPQVFVENLGQFESVDVDDILFHARISQVDFYFTKSGYTAQYLARYSDEEEHERLEKTERGLPVKPREYRKWTVEFLGASSDVKIEKTGKKDYTFNYGISPGNTIIANTFETITYKDIYPNVDFVFTMKGDNGFKYDIVLNPGAKVEDIKLKYPEDSEVSDIQMEFQGFEISNDYFRFRESIPESYIAGSRTPVAVGYTLNKSVIGFNTYGSPTDETIIIDPWTVLVSPYTSGSDHFKTDWDDAGNVWVMGELGKEVAKYDNTGTLQWVYIDAVASLFHGDFVIRHALGEMIYTGGLDSDVKKVSPAGALVDSYTFAGGLGNEIWRVEYDEVNDDIIIGKGGGFFWGFILGTLEGDFSTDTEVEVYPNGGEGVADMVWMEIDPDGSTIYSLAADGGGGYAGHCNDLVKMSLPGFTAPSSVTTWGPFAEVANGTYSTYGGFLNEPNSYHGVAVDADYVYTYDADDIKKYDKTTLTVSDSTIYGSAALDHSGIAVDNCGNVYVGTTDSVVIFDLDLNHAGGFPMSGPVIDIRTNGSLLWACGEGFLVEIDISDIGGSPSLAAVPENCGACDGEVTADTTICGAYIFDNVVWSPGGATSLTATGLCGGWYTATMQFVNGSDTLTYIDSVEVIDGGGSITATEAFTHESCPGLNDGSITLTATSGTAPFDYDIGTASNSTGIFTDLAPGTYTITITDDNGCTYTSSITIDPGTGLTVDITITDESCAGAGDGSLVLTPTSGTAPYDYDIVIASNATGTFTDLDDGTYNITVTDDNGCTFTGTATINTLGSLGLSVVTQNNPSCFGFTDGSITIEAAGGTLPYDYTWVPTNPVPGATFNNIGDGTYVAYVTDDNGCSDSIVVTLTEPDSLYADLDLFNPECYGDQTGYAVVDSVFNAQGDLGNITYIWNPDPPAISGVGADSVWNLTAGTYTLTLNDDNGCSNEITFEITEPDELIFSELGYDPAYCRLFGYQSGNGVVFAAAGGGTPTYFYEWTNLSDMTTTNNTTWGGLNPGDYQIVITDANGCVLTQTITVDSLNPIAAFTVDSDQLDENCEGTEIVEAVFTNQSQYFANPNNPAADTTFFWNLDFDNVSWYISNDYFEQMDTSYAGEAIYTVCLVAQNKNGCTDTACKEIIVHSMPDLVAPNIFTPGGDGFNDEFTFEYKAVGIVEFKCLIVNRWGTVMAELNGLTDGWDGTDKSGSECVDGVYFYTYEALSSNGTVFNGQGTVQLLRDK